MEIAELLRQLDAEVLSGHFRVEWDSLGDELFRKCRNVLCEPAFLKARHLFLVRLRRPHHNHELIYRVNRALLDSNGDEDLFRLFFDQSKHSLDIAHKLHEAVLGYVEHEHFIVGSYMQI